MPSVTQLEVDLSSPSPMSVGASPSVRRLSDGGTAMVAAWTCSIEEIDAAIVACRHHMQQILASGRDSYRERVAGTTRTVKHTRREVEARLAALARSRELVASGNACTSGQGTADSGILGCPCCGSGELAESDRETRERRTDFVRDILRLAEAHQGVVDATDFERRVWKLATKYIA